MQRHSRPLAAVSGRRALPGGALLAALCIFGLLLGAARADAATRFAKPGGTGPAPCEASNPCSLFTAASPQSPAPAQAGDVVVLLAGTYSGVADLGLATFSLIPGIRLQGAAGQPRPVIVTEAIRVAFGDVLSDLEIESSGSVGLDLEGGLADGVIVHDSARGSIACSVIQGRLVDSACIDSGTNGVAVMSGRSNRNDTVTLRNVTAIATEPGSTGLFVRTTGGGQVTVDAKAVIVEGERKDIRAESEDAGSRATVNLENSDFDSVEVIRVAQGTASITPPGSANNIITPPLLAADRIHQLAGSKTIDAGATDSSSGATDVDGEVRLLGRAADIGADEFSLPTTTTLSCAPAALVLGTGSAECTATVTNADPEPLGGVLRFAGDGQGGFSGGAGCTFVAFKGGQAGCEVSYTPSALGSGSHKITATYLGDEVSHGQSRGSALVGVSTRPNTRPNTTLKKKPRRKTASRLARFSFTSSEAGSSFQCKLDKKPFRPCRSPFKARVKPGRHSFQVRARSATGSLDPTPAVYRWKVL